MWPSTYQSHRALHCEAASLAQAPDLATLDRLFRSIIVPWFLVLISSLRLVCPLIDIIDCYSPVYKGIITDIWMTIVSIPPFHSQIVFTGILACSGYPRRSSLSCDSVSQRTAVHCRLSTSSINGRPFTLLLLAFSMDGQSLRRPRNSVRSASFWARVYYVPTARMSQSIALLLTSGSSCVSCDHPSSRNIWTRLLGVPRQRRTSTNIKVWRAWRDVRNTTWLRMTGGIWM